MTSQFLSQSWLEHSQPITGHPVIQSVFATALVTVHLWLLIHYPLPLLVVMHPQVKESRDPPQMREHLEHRQEGCIIWTVQTTHHLRIGHTLLDYGEEQREPFSFTILLIRCHIDPTMVRWLMLLTSYCHGLVWILYWRAINTSLDVWYCWGGSRTVSTKVLKQAKSSETAQMTRIPLWLSQNILNCQM